MYSSCLIHPQPHLLTFNHFLFFIVLSFCYFFSSSPSTFFNCALFISLSKTQALVLLSPTKATPLGTPPCLYQPLVNGFFFGSEEKNCRRNNFGRGFCRCLMSVGVVGFVINVVVVVVVEVVIDIDGGGFDECGYGWICD